MAEEYTPLFKLVQPDVGGSTNTWGDRLNADLLGIDRFIHDRGCRRTDGGPISYAYNPSYNDGSTSGELNYIDLSSADSTGLFIRVTINETNTTTTPTLNYNLKGAKPIRKLVDGVLTNLAVGELPDGHITEFVWHATLIEDGVWICLNPNKASADTASLPNMNQLCSHRNLVVEATDATHASVRADSVILRAPTGGGTKLFSGGINNTLDLAQTPGPGGRYPSGLARTANTWYSIYLIGKANGTIDSMLSATRGGPGPTGGMWNTDPSLPSGYTFYGFVGCIRTNSSSNFIDFFQAGNMATILDLTGTAGNMANVDYASVSLPYCPPEALSVRLGVSALTAVPAGGSGDGTPSAPGVAPVVAVRLAPAHSGGSLTTATIGETLLRTGTGILDLDATLTLKFPSQVSARSPSATAAGLVTRLQIFTRGYWL